MSVQMPIKNAKKKALRQIHIKFASVDAGAPATLPLHSPQERGHHVEPAQSCPRPTAQISKAACAPQVAPLLLRHRPDMEAYSDEDCSASAFTQCLDYFATSFVILSAHSNCSAKQKIYCG